MDDVTYDDFAPSAFGQPGPPALRRLSPSARRWFQYAWMASLDPETIRRTAREVIRRSDYQVTPVPNRGATLLTLFWQLVHWILSPLAWLFDALEGLPDWLRWFVVVGLALLVVVLIGHIIYTLATALRGPKRSQPIGLDDLQRPTDPAVFEQQAEHAAGQDDFITAIRLLFLACLVRLARLEKRAYRPGLTNREHLRRYYGTSFFKNLTVFVKTIDLGWYGDRTCARHDYEACRAAHGQIQRFLEESCNAHGA